MANFTIRYLKNEFQLSSINSSDAGGYGYVEILLIGVNKFSSLVRGKKFFWIKDGQRVNPFDECIAYLGKLLHGKWISESEYDVFVSVAFAAWTKYDASITGSASGRGGFASEVDNLAVWGDPLSPSAAAFVQGLINKDVNSIAAKATTLSYLLKKND